MFTSIPPTAPMSILTHILRLPGTLHAKLRRHQDRKAQARKWRDRRHRESRRARKDEADMSDAEFKREWARLRKGERQAEMKNGGSESEGKGGIDEGATEDDDEKRGWEGNGEAEEERSGRAGAMAENEGVLKHKREIEPVFIPNHVDVLYATTKKEGEGSKESLPRPSYAPLGGDDDDDDEEEEEEEEEESPLRKMVIARDMFV